MNATAPFLSDRNLRRELSSEPRGFTLSPNGGTSAARAVSANTESRVMTIAVFMGVKRYPRRSARVAGVDLATHRRLIAMPRGRARIAPVWRFRTARRQRLQKCVSRAAQPHAPVVDSAGR